MSSDLAGERAPCPGVYPGHALRRALGHGKKNTHGVRLNLGLHIVPSERWSLFYSFICSKITGSLWGSPVYRGRGICTGLKSVLLFGMAGSGMKSSPAFICYPFRESAPPALCPVMGIGSEGELTPDGGDSDEAGDEKTSRAIRSKRS